MENEKNRYIALRFFPWWDFFGNVSLSKLIWKSVSYHRGSKWLRPALPRHPFHFLQCQKFWNESTGVLTLRVNNKSRLWVIMGQSQHTSGLLLPLRWILTVACFTGLTCKQGKTSSINGVLTQRSHTVNKVELSEKSVLTGLLVRLHRWSLSSACFVGPLCE